MADDDQFIPKESTEETPAPVGAVDLDKFKAELLTDLEGSMNKRYAGWQKMLEDRDKKIGFIEQEIENVKTSTMSESEKEKHVQSLEKSRIDQLEVENALLKLGKEFPDEVPLFEEILAKNDPRSQLEILRRIRTGTTTQEPPADPAAPPAEGQPEASGTVDPNNPADDTLDGMTSEAAFERDPTLADKLLKSVGVLRR